MKKALFTFAIVLLAMAAQAQFKVQSDGQVSLGSLTTYYGLQVRSDGFTTFRTQYNTSGSWATLSYSDHNYQKHWIVYNKPNEAASRVQTFFVYGNGSIYSNGNFIGADSRNQMDTSNIENAGAVIDSISGIWYVPAGESGNEKSETMRRIGVSAQQVKDVLPEAVSANDDGLLYVNYDAFYRIPN